MYKRFALLLALLPNLAFGDFDYTIDNSNFTISQGSATELQKDYLYNYDRVRFRGDYNKDEFFATIIMDGVNFFGNDYVTSESFDYVKQIKSDTPFKTQTEFSDYNGGSAYAKLYRLYGGYVDEYNRVAIGVQNITMGVGRIWTPTNLFNPKNSYALEPDEVFGVAALSYTRHLDDTSHVTFVASRSADESFKYAARYKAYLDFADFAVDIVTSDETTMVGYEIEGNVYESGVELRSEGAYIKNSLKTDTGSEEKEFFQAIVGIDYGFVNGITLVAEALYSSESFLYDEIVDNYDSPIVSNLVYSNLYTAISLSYGFSIFLAGSMTYIESFNDENSGFFSPSLTYSLDDYNTFTLGAMMLNGKEESEFGGLENSYYFKYGLSF